MTEQGTLEKPTLGRPVQLGMLYDCRSDTLIPGVTLWDPDILDNYSKVEPHRTTDFKIISSDEVNDKAKALTVDGSLKISFLCGLVDVRGSAKYLANTKSSEHQSRLTLHYKTTTKFKELTMKQLGRKNVQHPEVFDQGTATHVVTGILYGAQAFFVFDSACSDTRKVKDGQGHLHGTLMKLFKSGVVAPIETSELKILETMNCTFHGDFELKKNPSNYTEAVKVYQELPSMLGSDGKKAVPVRMWLYPLHKLDDKSARLVREIDANVITQCQSILEGLDNLRVKCDDLIVHDVCDNFPQFRENLKKLQKMLIDYRFSFQQTLKHALPKIRGSADEENTLVDVIQDSEKSPFSLTKLGDYVNNKEEEMAVVHYCTASFFTDIPVIMSRDGITEKIMDKSVETFMCFKFPLARREAYLDTLSKYTTSSDPNAINETCFDKPSTQKIRLLAEYFTELYHANNKTRCHFGVTGVALEKDDAADAVILVFEKGRLVTKIYEPPGEPTILSATSKSHDKVTLEWLPPSDGKSEVLEYQVNSRSTEDHQSGWSDWKKKGSTKHNQLTIKGFKHFTSYNFQVAAVCRAGVSRISESFTVLPASPPEHVRKHGVSETSITIVWNPPSFLIKGLKIIHYKVRYEQITTSESSNANLSNTGAVATTDHTCLFTFEDVKNDTRYKIWVSAVYGDAGNSAESEPLVTGPDPVGSTAEYVKAIAEAAEKLEDGRPVTEESILLKIPLIDESDQKREYCCYSFGKTSRRTDDRHKVIMVVGATGAGKSTLINGMINYILGVEWEHEFRFKIIQEEERPQEHSQTQHVSSYTIYSNTYQKLSYKLTIIDTPGFGDTRGIERDNAIVDKVREFFADTTVDHIDAIGFVVQASLPRLTATQRYIFDSILALFGNDIGTNILFLITFCDGKKPPVINAIEKAEITHSKVAFFKFNNSALFSNSNSQDSFDELFWKMGVQSMGKFFQALEKLEPKNLFLTNEVLKKRERLKIAVQSLQPKIQMGLCKQDEIRTEQKLLEQHEAEIQAHKSFTYVVEVPKCKKVPIFGKYITNCAKCHFTCHYPCKIADDKQKSGCYAMDDNGYCEYCPGKCFWDIHFNQKYKFVFYSEKETRTYAELQEKYKDATGKKLNVQEMIKRLEEELRAVASDVRHLIADSHRIVKRLDEIALKTNPLTTVDYVDLLIESENHEAKPGWKSRVQTLHLVRKQAGLIDQVKDEDFDPFPMYREELEKDPNSQGTTKSWYHYFGRAARAVGVKAINLADQLERQ